MTNSPARPRTRLAAAALLALSVALLVACSDERVSGDSVRGLVVLSGDVGTTRLTAHAASDGSAGQVDPPDPATSWISAGPGGQLLATLADGRLAVRKQPDDWRIVPAGESPPPASLLFAATSPDGKRAAALTLGSAGQFGVAIVDLASGETITFPVEGEPMLTSPAWLDDARVGIVSVDEPSGGAVSIADVSSGDVTGGPGNVRAVAMSGDGQAVAWIDAATGLLQASNARSWLADEQSGTMTIEAPSGSRPGSFALDGTGGRLAVVWERDDGTVARIDVLRRTSDGWSLLGRLDPPGGDPRAVVSWMR